MSSTILSITEAIDCLDLDIDSNINGLDDILSGIDAYIENATGYVWRIGDAINPTAKAVARLLLKVEYTGITDDLTQKRITARLLQLRSSINEKR